MNPALLPHAICFRGSPFCGVRVFFCVIALTFVFFCRAFFAAEDTPAYTASLHPATGRFYQPGAWTILHVEVEPVSLLGEFRPRLRLYNEAEDESYFSCLLPAEDFSGGVRRFSFPVIARATAPKVEFALLPVFGGRPLSHAFGADALRPLGKGWRLILTPAKVAPVMPKARISQIEISDLPGRASGYEGADLLVLGLSNSGEERRLSRDQFAALLEWVLRGGVVLCAKDIYWAGLLREAKMLGMKVPPPSPFVLKGSRTAIGVTRLGFGLIARLPQNLHRAEAVMGGGDFWRKLRRGEWNEFSAVGQNVEAGSRYEYLHGWPAPDAVSDSLLLKWLLAWAGLCLAFLLVPQLRGRPFCVALGLLAISVVLGLTFVAFVPTPTSSLKAFTLSKAGEGGEGLPSFDEDIWVAAPFRDGEMVRLAFGGGLPPRFMPYDRAELIKTKTELDFTDVESGVLTISGFGDNVFPQRGFRLMFSRKRLGGAVDLPVGICAGRGDNASVTGMIDPLLTLNDCSVAAEGWRTFLSRDANGFVPLRPQTTFLASPRRLVEDMALRENRPGMFATFMGWRQAETGGDYLGTLVIYGLNRADGGR